MVLQGKPCGRVGRRRDFFRTPDFLQRESGVRLLWAVIWAQCDEAGARLHAWEPPDVSKERPAFLV